MQFVVRRASGLAAGLLLVASGLFLAQPAAATSPGFDGRIVFTRNAGDSPATGIYTVNADGSGLTQLTQHGGIYATYSADGSQIAYYGEAGIREMNSDGTDDHLGLPLSCCIGFRLSWSPDKSKFAFIQGVNGLATITVVKADGTGQYQLFGDDAYHEFDPAWSPDGKQLVFAKQPESSSEGDLSGIWVSDADGANAHRVAPRPFASFYASFSPDGSQIVYDNGTSLVVMNSDGTDAHPVGDLRGAAAFSPDGKWLLVSWNGDGDPRSSPGIWLMRANGSSVHQITRGADFLAEWQPLAAPAANLPPRAIGTAQNLRPLALFGNADAAWDFDGTIVSYEWRWGDYTAMTPYKYAWHKYAHAGTYLVRLTVTDDDGARTTRKAWVKVS